MYIKAASVTEKASSGLDSGVISFLMAHQHIIAYLGKTGLID